MRCTGAGCLDSKSRYLTDDHAAAQHTPIESDVKVANHSYCSNLIALRLTQTEGVYYEQKALFRRFRDGSGEADRVYHRERLKAVREITRESDDGCGSRRLKIVLNSLHYRTCRDQAGPYS